MEDLEGILDDSVEIHWQEMRFVRMRAREDELLKKSAVFKLAELLVQLDAGEELPSRIGPFSRRQLSSSSRQCRI